MATALRLWLVAAALGFSLLPAQTGYIAGKVTDAEGGVLPGVAVTVVSDDRRQTATTNSSGEYRMDQLQPGRYRIEAALPAFGTVSAENVVVEAARTAIGNATLKIARLGPADPFADFQTRVKQIVGPDAVGCGQHRLLKPRAPAPLAELQKSLACGLDVAQQRKAFWMSFQVQGVDGVILYGVAGTTTGTMYRLSDDSDTGDGTPSFSTQVCAKPSVSMSRGGYAEIVCSRP